DGLAPPEWLLNPLALLLADLVSTMADSATIDGGEAIGRVLGHVRCNVEVPHVGHKVSRIEALVGTHGDALGARRIAHDHVFRAGPCPLPVPVPPRRRSRCGSPS